MGIGGQRRYSLNCTYVRSVLTGEIDYKGRALLRDCNVRLYSGPH